MKSTLLLLSFFLSVSLFSQNVYIPDANFKNYLVNNPEINTNGDTEIQVSEASSFIGEIDCGGFNISDLTGIEAAWSTANWTINIDPQQYFSEDCDYPSDCFTTSLTELTTSKNLIQILDMMGSETSFKPNTPLIYVYDDGSTEKVFKIE